MDALGKMLLDTEIRAKLKVEPGLRAIGVGESSPTFSPRIRMRLPPGCSELFSFTQGGSQQRRYYAAQQLRHGGFVAKPETLRRMADLDGARAARLGEPKA
jgi:hypothetical protein